jgi:uncharacterized glyoxalase superfamily protein PhnB
MPAKPSSDARQFFQAAPVLHVPHPAKAAAYYRDVLGFTCDFGAEEGAGYSVAWRENAAVHFLRGQPTPVGVHLFFWVGDIDALHAEFQQRGAKIISSPANQPYGLREMEVRDLNGIRLIFAQDIE